MTFFLLASAIILLILLELRHMAERANKIRRNEVEGDAPVKELLKDPNDRIRVAQGYLDAALDMLGRAQSALRGAGVPRVEALVVESVKAAGQASQLATLSTFSSEDDRPTIRTQGRP